MALVGYLEVMHVLIVASTTIRDEAIDLVEKYDGKYPHYGLIHLMLTGILDEIEIDNVIDSFTNPLLGTTKSEWRI